VTSYFCGWLVMMRCFGSSASSTVWRSVARSLFTPSSPATPPLPSHFSSSVFSLSLSKDISTVPTHIQDRTAPLPWSRPPEVDVFSWKEGKVVKNITLHPFVFSAPIRPDILHQAVVWYRASQRQGTHQAKTVGMVAHSTRKHHQQKGTGRARAGNVRAPHFKGGGVVFPPSPRDYSYDLPLRIRRFALRSALTAKLNEGRLVVLAEETWSDPKTKDFEKMLFSHGLVFELSEKRSKRPSSLLLCVSGTVDPTLRLASRRLTNVTVMPIGGLSVYDILRHTTLAISNDALDLLTLRLMKDQRPEYHEVNPESKK
jgi:large subunit ribosomal protein L4